MRISVIIPVFGVEAYIEKCADSLLSQSYPDIEYIFVNDCTKDNSMEVLNNVIDSRYSNKKNNIVIINKPENQGLPQARRSGVEVATGDYILHCDSDDWMEANAIEVLAEYIEKNNFPDMVCFSNYEVSEEKRNIRHLIPYPNVDKHFRAIIDFSAKAYMWASITKKEMYANIFYPTVNMLEDFVIMSQIVKNCKRICYLDEPLYSYRLCNNISVTHLDDKKKRYQKMCMNMSIVYDWHIHNQEYADSIDHLTFIYGWKILKGGVPKALSKASLDNLKYGIGKSKLFRKGYETSLRKRIEVKIAALLNFPSYF